jgi:hypothetical protein
VTWIAVLVCTACAGSREPQIGPQPIPADGAVAIAYDAGTRELVLELAPIDLPAQAGHEIEQPLPGEATIPVSGWLQGYRVEVLDANGRAVPRAVIHHVNIMAPDRRELFSPVMQRIGAVGHETAPVALPGLIGYPIEKGGRIMVSAMLHNPTGEAYHRVRVRVRFKHETKGWIDPIDVFPFYMDVTPPATLHSFDLPPGRSEQSWEAQPAVNGRILGMGGHVHQHATSLRLTDVTEGRVLYETAPVLDEAGRVTGMPQNFFLGKLGIPVRAAHTYRLTVTYENPTGDTIVDGGMGALGGIITLARGATWPTVDANDPQYEKDLEIRSTPHWTEMKGAPVSGAAAHTHRH